MDMYDDAVEIIRTKVADIKHVPLESLTEDTDLQELNVKSGEMVAVISALEDEFNAYIDIMKLRKCPTIRDIANYVVSLI